MLAANRLVHVSIHVTNYTRQALFESSIIACSPLLDLHCVTTYASQYVAKHSKRVLTEFAQRQVSASHINNY
jgi:hypothetical protein